MHGISRNCYMTRIRCYGNGITTIAAFPELGGSTVSDSSMANVDVSGNTITGCDRGGLATPVCNVGALIADAFEGAAGVDSNSVTNVSIDQNSFDVTELGILIAGGLAKSSASGQVSYNTVEVGEVSGNSNTQGNETPVCDIRQDAGFDDSVAVVIGNSVAGGAGCE